MLKVVEHPDTPASFLMIEFDCAPVMRVSPSFDIDKMFPPERRIIFEHRGKAGPYYIYEEI